MSYHPHASDPDSNCLAPQSFSLNVACYISWDMMIAGSGTIWENAALILGWSKATIWRKHFQPFTIIGTSFIQFGLINEIRTCPEIPIISTWGKITKCRGSGTIQANVARIVRYGVAAIKLFKFKPFAIIGTRFIHVGLINEIRTCPKIPIFGIWGKIINVSAIRANDAGIVSTSTST